MGILASIFKGGNPAEGTVEGGLKGVGDIAEGIISKFKADPTKVAELNNEIQQAMIKDREAMAQLGEQQYEAQLNDVKSARDMQIAALKQESWLSKNYIHLLASFITIGFFGLLTYMCKWDVPAANKDMLNIMLGALGTAWVGCVSFYFGSSAGSAKKDDTIKQLSQS